MLQLPPLSASYLAGLSDADRRYAVVVDKMLRQLLPLLQFPSYATPEGVDADIAAHVAEADPHTQYLLETAAALLYQPLNARLTDISTNLSAASGTVEKTGANTFGTYTVTAAGKALIDDADASAQRTTLGLGTIATQDANNVTITGGSVTGITDLVVADGGTGVSTLTGLVKGNGTSPFSAAVAGTDYMTPAGVSAAYQPLDSDLTAIALLTTTSFGRALLELANAAALRTAAGLGTIATQNANAVAITGGSVTGITDLVVADGGTGVSTLTGLVKGNGTSAFSAAVQGTDYYAPGGTDVAVADGGTGASTASGARTNLGLVIGTDVQAWDADLDTWATKTAPSGTVVGTTDGQTLTNKTIVASSNTISALATSMFAANVIDTDTTLAANSDTRLATQKATKAYVDASFAANDAMIYKGATDCSGNPNYPAANAGEMYRVSVAGKIGGASGVAVEAGDFYICNTDGTSAGNQATVGANWNVIQTNVVGVYYAGGTDVAVTDGGTGVSTLTGIVKGNGTSAFSAAVQGTDYYAPGGTDVAVADGGTGASTASGARTNLGLGTIAVQDANNVTITGGSVTGIADLAVADGGTGASTAAGARINLGLVIGTDVQAYDADLTAYATVTPSAYSLTLFDNAAASDWRTDLGLGSLATASSVTAAQISDASANGRSLISAADYSAMRTLLSLVVGTNVQAYDAELAALAGLTSAADKLPYWTGSGTAANADFSAYGRTLVDDADAATARTTLGLVIGTNVQAYDAELAALAGLTSAADKLPYFTGAGTAALATFTAAGRALVDDADAAAQRTTLGLGTIAVQDANNVTITGGSVTGITDIAVADGGTGVSTLTGLVKGNGTSAFSAAVQGTDYYAPGGTDIAVADGGTGSSTASGARTNLGLVIGTDIQAYDAELAALAGLTSAADRLPYFTGSGTAALATFTAAGRALVDDADAAAQRTTLGLAIGTNVQAFSSNLTSYATVTPSAFSLTLFDDTSASSWLSTLGLPEKLTADRTYYVRVDGSDSNTGLVNSAGGAFLTIQKAVDTALTLNCNKFKVTINLGNGTYTAGIRLIGRLRNAYDSANRPFQIIGDSVTPANVVISTTSNTALTLWDAGLYLEGVTLQTTTGGYGMLVQHQSNLELGHIRFGNVAGEMIACQYSSAIEVNGTTDVVGDANSFCHVTKDSIVSFSNQTINFSKPGGNSFSSYVWGLNNASVECDGCTLTGAIIAGNSTIHDHSFLNFYSATISMTTSHFGPGTLNIEDGSVVTDTLQQTLNYYVNPLGSDNNDGLANTAARAFLTIQGALDRLSTFPRDANKPSAGLSAKIYLADGTYAEVVKPRSMSAFESVRIIGNATTPTNVIISGTTDAINASAYVGTAYSIESCRLVAASGYGIRCENGNELSFVGVDFNTATAAHIYANNGGTIECAGNYTISGGSPYHILATGNGTVDYGSAAITVTVTANVTFSAATVRLKNASVATINSGNVTWSLGAFTVTGKRFDVTELSVLNTYGGSTSYIPGTTAGTSVVTVTEGGTGVGTLTGLVKGNGTSPFSAAVAGTDYMAGDPTLVALAAYNTNGLLTQTAADTFTGRTITGPAAGITVTNGNGVSGNPTLSLTNDLSALEGLAGTGIAARTATDTWAQRTITGTALQITVTDGNGVSGNPRISLPDAVAVGSAGGGAVSVTVRGEAATQFNVFRYSDDATQPQITLNKARGTIASPAYPSTNDVLGQVQFMGNSRFGADIRAVAQAATPDAADMYTRLEIATAGSGSISRTVRFRIDDTGFCDSSGNVLIDTGGRINIGATSERTAAQIIDKTNAINTASKYRGKLVWDTTNNRMLRASNTSDVSPWHVVDGSATVTPV